MQQFINLIGLEDDVAKPPERVERSSRVVDRSSDGRKHAHAGLKIRFDSSATSSSYQGERVRLRPSKYYGIEIYAERLLFVIDCSGSMDSPSGETTRLASAKPELAEAYADWMKGANSASSVFVIT